MALKTTIGPKGVVTEAADGADDQLVVTVGSPQENITKLTNSAGTVPVTGGASLFLTRTAVVTASLPAVASTSEGARVLLMLDGAGNNVVAVSGSAGALSIDGSVSVNMSGAYGHLELVSVAANNSGSYMWHVLDRKPAL